MAASHSDNGELLAREPNAFLALWNDKSGRWEVFQKDDKTFPSKLKEFEFKDSEN